MNRFCSCFSDLGIRETDGDRTATLAGAKLIFTSGQSPQPQSIVAQRAETRRQPNPHTRKAEAIRLEGQDPLLHLKDVQRVQGRIWL